MEFRLREAESLRSLRDAVDQSLRRCVVSDAQRLAAYEVASNALARAYMLGRVDQLQGTQDPLPFGDS
jgi:hypothetical protein